MKISKNKLTRINKNLTLSVDMNRREVTRLSEELRVSRDSFNGLRIEARRMKDKTDSLSKDLAVYTQLCEMLSSELLSARIEIQRQRYDMRHEAATPDTYKVPQVEAKVTGRHFDTIRSDKLI